jgi:hypothetical protein
MAADRRCVAVCATAEHLVAAHGTDAVHAQPNRCPTTSRTVLSEREDAAAATDGTADQGRNRTAAATRVALNQDGGYTVEDAGRPTRTCVRPTRRCRGGSPSCSAAATRRAETVLVHICSANYVAPSLEESAGAQADGCGWRSRAGLAQRARAGEWQRVEHPADSEDLLDAVRSRDQ